MNCQRASEYDEPVMMNASGASQAETRASRVRCASARTLKLLACSPISCFNFNMETLSFGIDPAPEGQKSLGYAVGLPINLQPSHPSATMVNTFPRS